MESYYGRSPADEPLTRTPVSMDWCPPDRNTTVSPAVQALMKQSPRVSRVRTQRHVRKSRMKKIVQTVTKAQNDAQSSVAATFYGYNTHPRGPMVYYARKH